jgi:hypothetical protein
MKTTLQFNDEEHHEVKMAIHASNLYCDLWNTLQGLRKLLKHRDDLCFSEDQEDAIRKIIVDGSETIDFLE